MYEVLGTKYKVGIRNKNRILLNYRRLDSKESWYIVLGTSYKLKYLVQLFSYHLIHPPIRLAHHIQAVRGVSSKF